MYASYLLVRAVIYNTEEWSKMADLVHMKDSSVI